MFNHIIEKQIKEIRLVSTWSLENSRYSVVIGSDYWDTDKYITSKLAVNLINLIDSELVRRSK